ncbi:MAG: nicotinate (nicotinamide) nucleotide adenylyltransferase [Oscillospiraceae bacterium]|nr:nicotinate (nicotinamide) nucleotide adenylyltransferase [Oscillospiraceae bacterium]
MLLLYGGSFDPPHNGHIRAARRFLSDCPAEEVLIIPTGDAPLKEAHEAGAADRIEMCRIAFKGIRQAKVSDIEMQRTGISYTIDTVREIHATHPMQDMVMLIGSDQLAQFPQWKDWEGILELSALHVLPRTRESSTFIRANPSAHRDMLPPQVYEYIRQKGLYGIERTA